MKKILLALVMTFIVAMLPSVVLAAPYYLPAEVSSTATDLIVITNPPSFSSTQRSVVFSGYGKNGTNITLYVYEGGSYRQLTTYGAPVTANINASGVFWKKVDFTSGNKKILIRAENSGRVQYVKREVAVFNPNLADKIKGYSVNIPFALQNLIR